MPRFLSSPLDRRAVLAGVLGIALPGAAHGQTPSSRATPIAASAPAHHAVEITARRIESFRKFSSEKRFGRLEFRGGLVLTSTDKDFGGLSGLVVEPDGRGLFMVVDSGSWVSADLTYDGSAPSGLVNGRLGGIVAQSGRDLTRRRDQDAEAVALLEGTLARGTLMIAFERNHRIGRFPIVNRVLQPPTSYLKMPPEIISRRVSPNKGLEAMTVMAGGPYKGAVIAFSERFTPVDGHHTGWIWINGEPQRLNVTDVNDFDLTDCVSLPDGSLLLLERRFRWTEGVKMQLRLFKPEEIGPGKIAEGSLLIAADMTSEIDNMEGMAVHRDARGQTVITLVSDDNFNSFLQRTILLQFGLV